MRKLFVCLAIMCQLMSYAQNSTTISELENNIDKLLDNPSMKLEQLLEVYFKQNILNLKTIEGKFHCSKRLIPCDFARSLGITEKFSDSSPNYIFYSQKRNKYYRIGKGGESFYSHEETIIPQSSNTYIWIFMGQQNEINNPNRFEIVDKSAIDDVGVMICYYVKMYPTEDMYKQAVTQAAIEAATPKEWSGTGFALKDGYLITNYHVIDGAGSIFVQGVNGNFTTKLAATVVASDQANDIALLKINDGRFTGFGNVPYQLRTSMADVGESVFALGYPLADVMGDEIKFTDGKISSRTGVQGAVNVYQISVPIQPGNSGGPLFDQQGRVVGITTASLNKDVFDAENVNYAVKTNYILNLIDSSVGRRILPTGAPMGNVSIPQKIKTVKNFVFFISCKK